MDLGSETRTGTADPGLACLVLISRYHGVPADAAHLRHRRGHVEGACMSEADLVLSARHLGFKCRKVVFSKARLADAPLPALMLDGAQNHFVLAGVAAEGTALIQEASMSTPTVISQSELFNRTAGRALVFASRASLTGELMRFDFSWFIPAIIKYRSFLLEVLGLSAVLQILGLMWPLMFQVVMDKVLVNQSLDTLYVVCLALLAGTLVEGALAGIRNFILAHTTSRMDVELGARLFRHMLSLPLGYFVARRVGDTVARIRELEGVRNFLTGQALTAVMDLVFSLVLIAIMFIYSATLTFVVLASLPLYAVTARVLNPVFQRMLNQKFARSADTHSMLVESVSAVETIKAMAVEPQFTRRWDQQLAAYVAASFRVVSISNIAQQLIQLIGKLVSVITLFIGAKLVIQGRLTVGELIAFNMMSQRVAAPVMRLAQLWQEFQQVGLSMERLGDILNTRPELTLSRQALPQIEGRLEFEDVHFRYAVQSQPVLQAINFKIEPGQVVGIVGRSGSGKSTLTKLVQRLYLPERGRITVDGHDLAMCDPAWLRRQVGVVLQENRLFNGTVRDNIALVNPGAPMDQIVAVSKLAGIHDSIARMPEGYDSRIGENGTALSGGQRQRIAIARALLSNPRILIFDEATSALDYETERTIQTNMQQICAGRTVLIVAHRLSAVRNADRILAMDNGQVVEMGQHDELVARRGYYANLVALQNQGAHAG